MLIVVIEDYAHRIESMDMQIVKESIGTEAIAEMIESRGLLRFESAYVSLATLLKRLRPVAPRIAFNTPPRQTTVPQNPNYSGGSTGTSSSIESKPETYAQDVARDFVKATCLTIGKWLHGIDWINPAAKAYLLPQYVHGTSILTSVVAKMCRSVLVFKV